MASSEPREYRILANLAAAIAGASLEGGYYYALDDRAVRLDVEAGMEELLAAGAPRPFVLIEVGDEPWEYFADGEIRLELPVDVYWVHSGRPPADALLGEPGPIELDYRAKVYWRGCADVERAIAVDPGRGGDAVDTRIVGRSWEAPVDGQDVWAHLKLRIKLHRRLGDPS